MAGEEIMKQIFLDCEIDNAVIFWLQCRNGDRNFERELLGLKHVMDMTFFKKQNFNFKFYSRVTNISCRKMQIFVASWNYCEAKFVNSTKGALWKNLLGTDGWKFHINRYEIEQYKRIPVNVLF